MRLLAILWAEPPTSKDWQALSRARTAIGYTEKIQPVKALEGSPGRILAIGKEPDWACEWKFVRNTDFTANLEEALAWCLEAEEGVSGDEQARVLSQWMGGEVKYKGEEPYESKVGFA